MPSFGPIPSGYFKGQTQPLANDDHSACGGTIAQMLPPSCDTGYAILGTKIGTASMIAEADGFGFNQQPPIDLPHPSDGEEISEFLQPSCYENAQVFLACPPSARSAPRPAPCRWPWWRRPFADGGAIMTPHVMAQIRDSDGNLVEKYQPTVWKQATTPATAAAVTNLMRQVVTAGTAAGVGFAPQDDVAAKTGTAQAGVGQPKC